MIGIDGKRRNGKVVAFGKSVIKNFHVFVHDGTNRRTTTKEKFCQIDFALEILVGDIQTVLVKKKETQGLSLGSHSVRCNAIRHSQV